MNKMQQSQINANYRYARKTYDTIVLNVPKGAKEEIKALAEAQGDSVNKYICKILERETGVKLTLDGEFKTGK